MACAVAPLNFNVFLEKAKLKDDGSNFMDWARNLRIILMASHSLMSLMHRLVRHPLQPLRTL